MAFRDKQKADSLRIDSLEKDLDEKDAEIARLKKELAARDDPSAKKKRKKRPTRKRASIPEVDELPEGDEWDVETTHPEGMWKWGLGWLGTIAGGATYVAATTEVRPALLIPLTIFTAPALLFLRRTGLTMDRKRRKITRWDWLVVRFRRRYSVEGKELTLVSRELSPKNGRRWTAGVLQLDDRELFMMKIGKARALARRVAAFLGVGLIERRETTDEIVARAHAPLRFVAGFMLIAAIVGGILKLLM